MVLVRSVPLRPDKAYVRGANNLLPPDVRIESVARVGDDFHPRYSAITRTYTYLMYKDPYLPAAWMGRAYVLGRGIDLVSMRQACALLIGHHDFSAFRAAGCQSLSPYREVYALELEEGPLWLVLRITANAYVYRMVRKISQALLYVGIGMWSVERFREVFASGDGTVVPPLRPDGLYLTDITYPIQFGEANKKRACWLDAFRGDLG
jgi:tRNA pseudouridine38-40 synthase